MVLRNPQPQEIPIPCVEGVWIFSRTAHLLEKLSCLLFLFLTKNTAFYNTIYLFFRIVNYAQILVEFSRRQILGSKWQTGFFLLFQVQCTFSFKKAIFLTLIQYMCTGHCNWYPTIAQGVKSQDWWGSPQWGYNVIINT